METFLACAVREIHEALSFYVPPERVDLLTRLEGADPENPEGTVGAEFFIVRGLRVSDLTITAGQLLVVEAFRAHRNPPKTNAERTLGARCHR